MAALDLALTFDIAYYDALYVQLADELGFPSLTADRPLHAHIIDAFPATLLETL